jgi:hypothetical protein
MSWKSDLDEVGSGSQGIVQSVENRKSRFQKIGVQFSI